MTDEKEKEVIVISVKLLHRHLEELSKDIGAMLVSYIKQDADERNSDKLLLELDCFDMVIAEQRKLISNLQANCRAWECKPDDYVDNCIKLKKERVDHWLHKFSVENGIAIADNGGRANLH